MALLLFAFWVALNARLTLEVAAIGLIVLLAVLAFLCAFTGWSLRKELAVYRLLPRAVLFALALLWEIVKANMGVARVVYFGKPKPVVRHIQTKLSTRTGRTMLCNAITLTPGTISLLEKDGLITVHCLTQRMAQGLDDMPLEKRLLEMEAIIRG